MARHDEETRVHGAGAMSTSSELDSVSGLAAGSRQRLDRNRSEITPRIPAEVGPRSAGWRSRYRSGISSRIRLPAVVSGQQGQYLEYTFAGSPLNQQSYDRFLQNLLGSTPKQATLLSPRMSMANEMQ